MFPVLELQQIVEDLKCMDIVVDIGQLQRPNEEFVRRVLSEICYFCMGDDGLVTEENNDALVEGFDFIRFYSSVKRLGKAACLKPADLTLASICEPSAEGFKLIICAFINYAKFMEHQIETIGKYDERSAKLQAEEEPLSVQILGSETKLKELEKICLKDEPKLKKLKTECVCLQNDLETVNKELNFKNMEINEIQKEIQQQEIKLRNSQMDSVELNGRLGEWKSQIVPHPDQLEAQIVETKNSISKCRRQEGSLEAELGHLSALIESSTSYAHLVQDIIGMLKKLEEDHENSRNCANNNSNQVEKFAEKKTILSTKTEHIVGIHKEIKCFSNELDSVSENLKRIVSNKRFSLQERAANLESIMHQKYDHERQHEATKSKIENLSREIEKEKNNHSKDIQRVMKAVHQARVNILSKAENINSEFDIVLKQ